MLFQKHFEENQHLLTSVLMFTLMCLASFLKAPMRPLRVQDLTSLATKGSSCSARSTHKAAASAKHVCRNLGFKLKRVELALIVCCADK